MKTLHSISIALAMIISAYGQTDSEPLLVTIDSLGNLEGTLSATSNPADYFDEIKQTDAGGWVLLALSEASIPPTWVGLVFRFDDGMNSSVESNLTSVFEKTKSQLMLLGYTPALFLLPGNVAGSVRK